MSVDPDDNTPGAIRRSGADIVTYGAPVLPGAMFLLGYYEDGAARHAASPAASCTPEPRSSTWCCPASPPGSGWSGVTSSPWARAASASAAPSAITPSAPSASDPLGPSRGQAFPTRYPRARITKPFHPALSSWKIDSPQRFLARSFLAAGYDEPAQHFWKGSTPHEEGSLPAPGADPGPEPRGLRHQQHPRRLRQRRRAHRPWWSSPPPP